MLIITAAQNGEFQKRNVMQKPAMWIHKPSGKKFHYGELVIEASKLEAPKDVKLKTRSEYKLIGKPLRRRDTAFKNKWCSHIRA
jgi:isoquinoline 1-oxidoreductase beta subunit